MRVLLILIFVLTTSLWAKDDAPRQHRDSSHTIDTVSIFGDDYYTPFILGTGDSDYDSTEVRQQIDSRALAKDEFFMRNIDREEFESERSFLQFLGDDPKNQNRKRPVWAPFKVDKVEPKKLESEAPRP